MPIIPRTSQHHRRRGTLAGLAAILSLGVTVAPAPAHAATDGTSTLTTRANSLVKSSTCGNAASYRLNVDLAAIATEYNADDLDWTADITVTGPGAYLDSGFVWADTSWQPVFICESPSRAGTYTVTADITVDGWKWDSEFGDYLDYDSSLYTKTLQQKVTLHPPKARSALTSAKAHAGKHRWRSTATLRVDGKLRRGATVKLQRRTGAHWVRVATRHTDRRGHAVATLRGRPGKFRWYFAGSSTVKPDASRRFRLPLR